MKRSISVCAIFAQVALAGCSLDVELAGKNTVERDGETICEEWRLECRAGTRPDAPIPDMVDAEPEAKP